MVKEEKTNATSERERWSKGTRKKGRAGRTLGYRVRERGASLVKERPRKLKKALAPRVLAARHTRREAEVNPHQRSSRRLKIPAHAIFMTVSSTDKVAARGISTAQISFLQHVRQNETCLYIFYLLLFVKRAISRASELA